VEQFAEGRTFIAFMISFIKEIQKIPHKAVEGAYSSRCARASKFTAKSSASNFKRHPSARPSIQKLNVAKPYWKKT
jgi:hypothetical protein